MFYVRGTSDHGPDGGKLPSALLPLSNDDVGRPLSTLRSWHGPLVTLLWFAIIWMDDVLWLPSPRHLGIPAKYGATQGTGTVQDLVQYSVVRSCATPGHIPRTPQYGQRAAY